MPIMSTVRTTLAGMITLTSFHRKGLLSAAVIPAAVLWVVAGCVHANELPAYPLEWKNSIGMRLSYIPAGTFTMGSPADERGRQEREHQRDVVIRRPFYMGVTEVTQAEYVAIMGANPSLFGQRQRAEKTAAGVAFDFHPVERVSWDNAVEFCEKLAQREQHALPPRVYRLPTEAEWEHACRAGKATLWSFGTDVQKLSDHAWYARRDAERTTQPVGQKLPNAWGLHDMHGNVWEWCSDWYAEDYGLDAPLVDPRGPAKGLSKVIRGGAYLSVPAHTRSATRFHDPPEVADEDVGFRVVMEICPDKNAARRLPKRDARPE